MKCKHINRKKIMVNSKTKAGGGGGVGGGCRGSLGSGEMLKAVHENASFTSWRKSEEPV